MVSGFKTSPLDSAKIDSGDASPIVILSNRLMVFLSLFLLFILVVFKIVTVNGADPSQHRLSGTDIILLIECQVQDLSIHALIH